MNFIDRQRAANRKDPLTKEQLEVLIYKAQDGDIKARNTIIEKNIGLVWQVVGKHNYYSNFNVDDYFQEGIIGMIRAIQLFDPLKGFAFSTYATLWISQRAGRFYANNITLIRMPLYAQQLKRDFKKIKLMHPEYTSQYIIEILAKENQCKTKLVAEIIKSEFTYTSLSRKIDDGNEDAIQIQYDDKGIAQSLNQMDIDLLITKLEFQEFRIVKGRLNGLKLQQIADQEDLSRERIRQIYEKAVIKMKAMDKLRKW